MNFHPIDRPTEPGRHWHRRPDGTLFPFLIVEVDGKLVVDLADPTSKFPPHDPSDFPGQWFAPRIPEPTESFANQTFH